MPGALPRPTIVSRADTLPRKVVVASAVAEITGPVETRLKKVGAMIDDTEKQTHRENR